MADVGRIRPSVLDSSWGRVGELVPELTNSIGCSGGGLGGRSRARNGSRRSSNSGELFRAQERARERDSRVGDDPHHVANLRGGEDVEVGRRNGGVAQSSELGNNGG